MSLVANLQSSGQHDMDFLSYMQHAAALKVSLSGCCCPALSCQILQQRLCTGDAANQSLRVAPIAAPPLSEAIHADVNHKIA